MHDAILEILLMAKDISDKAFATYTQKVSGVTKAVNLLTGGLATLAGGAAVGLVTREFYKGVRAASDFEETLSKVQTLFGSDEAAAIKSWGEEAAYAMGLSSQAALDAVGDIGDMFLKLGANAKDASSLSRELVGLSSDIASFKNVSGGAAAVLETMQSAFRGEYDALQRYIPTINAAAVEQEALAETGKRTGKELTVLDKALAVYRIILNDAGAATGDFSRTSHGLANALRTTEGIAADTRKVIGEDLMPVVADIVVEFNSWHKANKEIINSKIHEYVGTIADGIVVIADNADKVITVMRWIARATAEGTGIGQLQRVRKLIEAEIGIYENIYREVRDALGMGPTGAPGGYSADEFMGTEKYYAPVPGADQTVEDLAKIDKALAEYFSGLDDYENRLRRFLTAGANSWAEDARRLNAAVRGMELDFDTLMAKADNWAQDAARLKAAEMDYLVDLDLDAFFADLDKMEVKAESTAEAMRDAFMGWGAQFSATLNDAVWGAELSFDRILESFGRMTTQIIIQKKVVEPMMSDLLSLNAHGNVYNPSGYVAFGRGGVVTKPTLFPFARGIGLMGEEGYEAIVPLRRLPNGDLGVQAGGGGLVINNIINNYTGARVTTRERETPQGMDIVTIIDDISAGNMARRGSSTNRVLRSAGARPPLVRR